MSQRRISFFVLKIALMLLLSVGLSRVVFLSVFMGDYYEGMAKGNMVRRVSILPARGIITDRTGKSMALNIEVSGKTFRFYPYGEMLAGVTGYLSRASREDLEKCSKCSNETLVGKSGLEKIYDNRLMGTWGEVLVEESAEGVNIKEISRINPVFGENIKTNIDLDIQKSMFLSLKSMLNTTGKSASGVVAKINGEVLALVSLPSYDANLFINSGKRSDYGGEFKDVQSIVSDNDKKPLYNRVVSGQFAPGSVYKVLTALAGLSEGKITSETIIEDTGEIKIGEYRFGNWFLDKYGKVEGALDVEKALSRSNDIFFYKLGEMLGVESLVKWSETTGLGKKTGIDLPFEADGFVPTPYWREKYSGAKWFLGNTYHMSIGQGDLLVTPLQINRMTAAVISGEWCTPLLVGIKGCREVGITKKNIEVVKKGMEMTCREGGTAFPLFEYGGKIYCKTGTAQQGGEKDEPHAWISVVVPKGDDIKEWLVVTVLVEAGGEGSAVAGPVVKEMMPVLMKK